jgi:hypothetical protein
MYIAPSQDQLADGSAAHYAPWRDAMNPRTDVHPLSTERGAPRRRRLFAAALLLAGALAGGVAAGDDPDPHDLGLSISAGPFDLVLRSCTFIADRLECLLKAHNRLGTAVPLQVGSALVYDTVGKAYRDAEIRLGGQTDRGEDGREPLRILVPGETPIQVLIVFTDVSRQKRKASKLVVEIDDQPTVELGPFPFARDRD